MTSGDIALVLSILALLGVVIIPMSILFATRNQLKDVYKMIYKNEFDIRQLEIVTGADKILEKLGRKDMDK